MNLEITKAMLRYKKRWNGSLKKQNSNLGLVWDDLKTIVGTKPKRDSTVSLKEYRDYY